MLLGTSPHAPMILTIVDWIMPLARRHVTAGLCAVIPAKAGIQIFSQRKPGTRLAPAFQRGDVAATRSPLSRGEFWIPVYTGMTLVALFRIFAELSLLAIFDN